MKKTSNKQKIHNKFSIPQHIYHTVISILIGVGMGVVLLGVVAYFTRDYRPTQYFIIFLQEKLGIERSDKIDRNTEQNEFYESSQ